MSEESRTRTVKWLMESACRRDALSPLAQEILDIADAVAAGERVPSPQAHAIAKDIIWRASEDYARKARRRLSGQA